LIESKKKYTSDENACHDLKDCNLEDLSI
jgi:hypothetical protein